MKKMSKKILFFGNERLATGLTTAAPALQALIAAKYEIMGLIIAQNDQLQSRQPRNLEIVKVAQEHGIPVWAPTDLRQAVPEITALRAEVGVLVAYGRIVPPEVINIFPGGIINIHPSLLPKHRGPTPIENVILDGNTSTGVSLMQISAKMDAGPVFAQQILALSGTETKQVLSDKLSILGSEVLIKHLPSVLAGRAEPTAQNDEIATYDNLVVKADGNLDWTKPAVVLEREIRAYAGWPRSRAIIGTTDVIVTRARVITGTNDPGTLWIEDKQLGVYTREGILIIDRLIPAGKKEMPGEAFLTGYKTN